MTASRLQSNVAFQLKDRKLHLEGRPTKSTNRQSEPAELVISLGTWSTEPMGPSHHCVFTSPERQGCHLLRGFQRNGSQLIIASVLHGSFTDERPRERSENNLLEKNPYSRILTTSVVAFSNICTLAAFSE